MKGLLLRLSSLDADAAAAVRVIAHFQGLLSGGAVDPSVLVRSTAGLAGCPSGMETADGRVVRCGPDGIALTGEAGAVSASVELRPAGRVWLERDGASGPLDALVLEWMAIAAQVGPGQAGPSPRRADPALVELVLSEREAIEDRTRALRLLGLHPGLPLRAVAVAADPASRVAPAVPGAASVPGHRGAGLAAGAATPPTRSDATATVRVASVGSLTAALVQAHDGTDSSAATLLQVATAWFEGLELGGERPRGARCGVGGSAQPIQTCVSWAQARTALRFAAAGSPQDAVVDHDALGPLALLAEVHGERLRSDPAVVALGQLAAQDGGELSIAALAAFCRTGSLRQAAAALHLHHSSVAARLAGVEAALGWRLREPSERLRAQLALYAWRLATAAD